MPTPEEYQTNFPKLVLGHEASYQENSTYRVNFTKQPVDLYKLEIYIYEILPVGLATQLFAIFSKILRQTSLEELGIPDDHNIYAEITITPIHSEPQARSIIKQVTEALNHHFNKYNFFCHNYVIYYNVTPTHFISTSPAKKQKLN